MAMHRNLLRWWAVTLAGAAGDPSPPALDAPHMSARRFELVNGLQVVIHEDHRAPLVALHLRYHAGAARDTLAEPILPGIAHLVEHMAYQGSPHAPGDAYDRWLGLAGGDDNAWTDHDDIAFHLLAPAPALDLALFLEADRMVALAPAPEALETERKVVANEAAEAATRLEGQAMEALAAALYPPGHPYHHPVMGDARDLSRVTVADVEAFHQTWMVPSEAVLVVSGDVDPARAEASVRRWFGQVPARPHPPEPAEQPVMLSREVRAVHAEAVDGGALYLAWPTVARGDPAEPALDLLADVLTGRLSRLVDHPPHFDGAHAWTRNRRLAGELIVRVADRRHRFERMLKRVDAVLADLRAAPPSAEELERVKARWRSWAARAAEDPEDRASILADCEVTWHDPDCLSIELARHLAVGPADVQHAAERWLPPHRRVVLSIVPDGRTARALGGSRPVDLP